jgi:hypothetical protein
MIRECISTKAIVSEDNARLMYTDNFLSVNLIKAVIEKISASSSLTTHIHTVISHKRESKVNKPNIIEMKKVNNAIKEIAVRMTDNPPARLLGMNFIAPPPEKTYFANIFYSLLR